MKVIGFSLWGDNPKYCQGAVKNAALAQQFYPDWVCRFYIGAGVPMEIQGQLANHDNVDLYDMPEGLEGWKGMFARFLPIEEEDVEVMISRDCDSRIGEREQMAVKEWLMSDKGVHIMRDHPWHGTEILGGMWGMKSGALPEFLDLMYEWHHEDRWQTDQDFLKEEIYPRIVDDTMVHDNFFGINSHGIPFPTSRKGVDFVGQVFDENDKTVIEHASILARYLKTHPEVVRTPDWLRK